MTHGYTSHRTILHMNSTVLCCTIFWCTVLYYSKATIRCGTVLTYEHYEILSSWLCIKIYYSPSNIPFSVIVKYSLFSFHRSNDGLKSFEKLRQEKDRENSKLNKIERKQDKMLFVAFYILLNLVSKWAKIVETFSWHWVYVFKVPICNSLAAREYFRIWLGYCFCTHSPISSLLFSFLTARSGLLSKSQKNTYDVLVL